MSKKTAQTTTNENSSHKTNSQILKAYNAGIMPVSHRILFNAFKKALNGAKEGEINLSEILAEVGVHRSSAMKSILSMTEFRDFSLPLFFLEHSAFSSFLRHNYLYYLSISLVKGALLLLMNNTAITLDGLKELAETEKFYAPLIRSAIDRLTLLSDKWHSLISEL